jgi:hypothetical protein
MLTTDGGREREMRGAQRRERRGRGRRGWFASTALAIGVSATLAVAVKAQEGVADARDEAEHRWGARPSGSFDDVTNVGASDDSYDDDSQTAYPQTTSYPSKASSAASYPSSYPAEKTNYPAESKPAGFDVSLCTYYMSSKGKADATAQANAGSRSNPFGTLEESQLKLAAGDTLCVLSGTYTFDTFVGAEVLARGTAEDPIRIVGVRTTSKSQLPKFVFQGAVAFDFRGARYVTMADINVDGGAGKLTLTQAVQDIWWSRKRFSSGLGRTCFRLRDKSRHVTIKKCACHDATESAVNVLDAYYTTIRDNIFYRIGWYGMDDVAAVKRSYVPASKEEEEDEYRLSVENNAIWNVESHFYQRDLDMGVPSFVGAHAISLEAVTDADSRMLVSDNLVAFNANATFKFRLAPYLVVEKNTIYSDPSTHACLVTDEADYSKIVLKDNIFYTSDQARFATHLDTSLRGSLDDDVVINNFVAGGGKVTGDVKSIKNLGKVDVFNDPEHGDFTVRSGVRGIIPSRVPGVSLESMLAITETQQLFDAPVIGKSDFTANHEHLTKLIIATAPSAYERITFHRSSPTHASVLFTDPVSEEKFTLRIHPTYAEYLHENGDVSPVEEATELRARMGLAGANNYPTPTPSNNYPAGTPSNNYPAGTPSNSYPTATPSNNYPAGTPSNSYPTATPSNSYPTATPSNNNPPATDNSVDAIQKATQDAVKAIQDATQDATTKITDAEQSATQDVQQAAQNVADADSPAATTTTTPAATPTTTTPAATPTPTATVINDPPPPPGIAPMPPAPVPVPPEGGLTKARAPIPMVDTLRDFLLDRVETVAASAMDLDHPDEDVSTIADLEPECYKPPEACPRIFHLKNYRSKRVIKASENADKDTDADAEAQAKLASDMQKMSPEQIAAYSASDDVDDNQGTSSLGYRHHHHRHRSELREFDAGGMITEKHRRALYAALGMRQDRLSMASDFVAPFAIGLVVVAAMVVRNRATDRSASEERASLLSSDDAPRESTSRAQKVRRSTIAASALVGLVFLGTATSTMPGPKVMRAARAEVAKLGSKLADCAGKFYVVNLPFATCSVRGSAIARGARPFPLEDYIKFESFVTARLGWSGYWSMKGSGYEVRSAAREHVLEQLRIKKVQNITNGIMNYHRQCLRTKTWCTEEGKDNACCRAMPVSEAERNSDSDLEFESFPQILRNLCACSLMLDKTPTGCGQIDDYGRDLYCDRMIALGTDDNLNKCCDAPNPYRVQECLCKGDDENFLAYT